MFRIPELVRLYRSALQLPVQPMLPTIGPLESRWRQDFTIVRVGVPCQPSRQHRAAAETRRAAAFDTE